MMTFPDRVISGAIHYFRVHPDLWQDRLERLAAMGLNAVETYVAWNFHSPGPGRYDFSGWRDLPRFIRLAGDLGLQVIVRPGPYICAEWEFGGLPAWLLRTPMQLRTSDPAYLAAVDEYLDAVIPLLAPLQATTGGPIIAVQVENEYGSYGDDVAYLEHLRDGLVRRGIDVPLFTSDGPGPDYFASGTLPGMLATANFGSRVDLCLGELEKFRPGEPQMVMEWWHGWFDHWGEEHHHTRDPQEAAGVLDDILRAGASVNMFMGHGGTNFGLWSGANWDGTHQPTVTSYDYDAPVGEGGEITPKFHAFRAVIGRYVDLPDREPPALPPRLAPQQVGVERWGDLAASAAGWGAPVRAPMPLPMEEVGSGRGLVLYRGSALVPPDGRTLILDGLADRAYVYADGALAAVVDAPEAEAAVDLAPSAGGKRTVIEVLVESRGRINFGHRLGQDRKGVSAIRLAHRHLHDWESIPIELDAEGFTTRLDLSETSPPAAEGPIFAATTIDVAAPADGFLALPGWGRGFIWLNDFLLGRYDAAGPQVTLYAPAPLWRAGDNDVVVLEMATPGDGVEVRASSDLGPVDRG